MAKKRTKKLKEDKTQEKTRVITFTFKQGHHLQMTDIEKNYPKIEKLLTEIVKSKGKLNWFMSKGEEGFVFINVQDVSFVRSDFINKEV